MSGNSLHQFTAYGYERKADRLRSICILLSAFPFPFTKAPRHNLAVYTDRYRRLAEESRRKHE